MRTVIAPSFNQLSFGQVSAAPIVPATVEYQASPAPAIIGTPFNGITLVSSCTGKRIVIAIRVAGFDNRTIVSATVNSGAGAHACTISYNKSVVTIGGAAAAFAEITGETGTSIDVNVTCSGPNDVVGISVYLVSGSGGTVTSTDFDDASLSSWSGGSIVMNGTVSGTGCCIGTGTSNAGSAGGFGTYVGGLTEDQDFYSAAAFAVYGSSHVDGLSGATAVGFTITDGSSLDRAAIAIFGLWTA